MLNVPQVERCFDPIYSHCCKTPLVFNKLFYNSNFIYGYFTYLLIPLSKILLEKLTGSQLVKKFPAFYETRRFITAFTSARHLSLS